MRGFVFLLLSIFTLGLVSRLHAWDDAGHMLVGEIARRELHPAVRERADALIALLDQQFNGARPYHFVTAGCWMDDMRAIPGYAWSRWHYVNIPWTPDGSRFALPEPPHVVWAMQQNLGVLRNPAAPEDEKALALAMLIHFVGDLHQPMHATDRNDRGGNGFFVRGITATTFNPRIPANLHWFWDAAYRFRGRGEKVTEDWITPTVSERPTAAGQGIIAEKADELVAEHSQELRADFKADADIESWARESHLLGCRGGYPSDAEPSDSELHALPDAFVDQARQTARRRIVQAGRRLAGLLNNALAP